MALTDAGLEIKDLETIIAEIVAEELANIDPNLVTEADSLVGIMNSIYSAALFEVWEGLQEVNAASYPDTATGNALTYLAALTGTERQAATKAELLVRVITRAPGLLADSGGVVFYPSGDGDSRFVIQSDVTTAETTTNADIGFGSPSGNLWTMSFSAAAATIYLNVNEVFEITNRNVDTNGFYRVTQRNSNTSYVVEPLDSQSISVATVNGDVVQTFAQVTALAETPGSAPVAFGGDSLFLVDPIPDDMEAIVTIADDGTGFPADYVAGRDEETDAELRARRVEELSTPGSATAVAIRADLLQVTGVDYAEVFENATDVVDADGRPPKSMEVLVYSTSAPTFSNAVVAQQIWDSKPAGTETVGNISETVTNTAGDTYTVKFSAPTAVPTYIEFTIDVLDTEYVGDTVVEDTLLAWHTTNVSVGTDILAADVIGQIVSLAGVVNVDVSSVRCGDTASPTTVDLILDGRQISTLERGNISITTVSV